MKPKSSSDPSPSWLSEVFDQVGVLLDRRLFEEALGDGFEVVAEVERLRSRTTDHTPRGAR